MCERGRILYRRMVGSAFVANLLKLHSGNEDALRTRNNDVFTPVVPPSHALAHSHFVVRCQFDAEVRAEYRVRGV